VCLWCFNREVRSQCCSRPLYTGKVLSFLLLTSEFKTRTPGMDREEEKQDKLDRSIKQEIRDCTSVQRTKYNLELDCEENH